MKRKLLSRVFLGILLALHVRSYAIAQSGSVVAQEPYQPPVLKFDPAGISLEEAVRLTLQHEPTIKVQEAAARLQEGAAQEQTGFFDVSLLGDLSYNYRLQELTEARKQSERDKRDRLQRTVDQNRSNVQRAQALIGVLQRVRDGAPGSLTQLAQLSPSIGGTIQVIDALIASAPSASARNDLINIRQDFVNRTLGEFQQNLQAEVTGFRAAEQSLGRLGAAPDDEVFYNGTGSLQFSKLFRTGISIAPFFDAALEGTNFKDKARAEDFGGKGLEDLFTFHVGVNLVLPLARGRGRDALGAAETAARIEHDAARLLVRHQQAVATLNTVRAYWDLRAAQETVDVATRSVELQAKLVELTRASIEAGELPQVELARVQASEARSRARLEDSRRGLQEARVALAIAIGVAASNDETSLPRARDEFPRVADTAGLQEPQVAGLSTQALERRRDLSAAQRQEEAGRVLERGALTNLRPRLDFVAGGWYTALEERNIANAVDRWVGPSTGLSLQFEKPLGNNFFRGQLLQREADLSQRRIASSDLGRQIKLGVVLNARSLQDAAARAQQAEAAVGHYQKTIEAEIERFQTGDATLIDTILTEAQQTEARLTLVAARQALAELVAQLRFETGTLVVDGAFAPQDLVTPPPAGAGRKP